MSSTRLPGKVMRDLAGAPMIERQLERLRRARGLDAIVVATSDGPLDDPLAAHAASLRLGVHRGSLDDVLGRFVGALDAFGPAEHLVRLTADCPLADPDVVDAVVARHLETGADYTSNVLGRRTFPQGLDVEVVRGEALRAAAAETDRAYDREHVTPFVYGRPERFRLAGLAAGAEEGDVRWTVDRPDDLEFVQAVYDGLYAAHAAFSSDEVRAYVRSRPDLHHFGGDRRV